MKLPVFFMVLFLLSACQPASDSASSEKSVTELVQKKVFFSNATAVLAKALAAHGGHHYEQAHYQFVFRDKTYTFKNDGPGFRYQVASVKGDTTIVDVLENGELTRTVNGAVISLSEKRRSAAAEALNSVVYFATLPHKLTDASVNLEYGGEVLIKDFKYETLNVTFDQEGGGVDFDDQYRYWINLATGRIDYLAYNYQTNGGGVRFREAYHSRKVEGIVFQNYVNYKAPVGTPLDSLPRMLEQLELEQLSLIEIEKVVAL